VPKDLIILFNILAMGCRVDVIVSCVAAQGTSKNCKAILFAFIHSQFLMFSQRFTF